MTERGALPRMSTALIAEILDNPAVSFWLKDAYRLAQRRDCVDALRDAELLAEMLRCRCESVLNP